jgi:hypothetical protein
MDFFKNIKISLEATGPAAVVCVWMLCFTLVAILASGEQAHIAMSTLGFFGGMIFVGLGSKIR